MPCVVRAVFLAKAPPDGYTLAQCNVGTNAIAMSLYARPPFDQVRDFAPVTRPSLQAQFPGGTRRHFAATVDGVAEADRENRRRAHSAQGRSAGRVRHRRRPGSNRRLQRADDTGIQRVRLRGDLLYGVCAPVTTPVPALEKPNADFGGVLRTPDVQRRLDELVVHAAPTTRGEFDQFIRSEITRWSIMIKYARIPQQ